MRLRIVAGEFGGRLIEAPGTKRTHPMGERIRNALFNRIGEGIKNASVLDAFAGSGAIGLEALSRGAKRATFIENDRVAFSTLKRNIVTLGLEDRATVIRAGVAGWLQTQKTLPQFDYVFADPPYDNPQLSTVSQLFALLKPGSRMILSHPGRGEVSAGTREIVVVDNRSYATAVLTFYRRKKDAQK